jgi:hypothetical protein
MFVYSTGGMEPAPPSALFAGPMNLGAWQDKIRAYNPEFSTDQKAIEGLKAFVAQYFDSPQGKADIAYLQGQGLIANTDPQTLVYYALTRIVQPALTDAEANAYLAAAFGQAEANQAAADQETHDYQLIREDTAAIAAAAAQAQAEAVAAAQQAAAAAAAAQAQQTANAVSAANAAAAAAKQAQDEAAAARAELAAAQKALADQAAAANAARAQAGQTAVATTTQAAGGPGIGAIALAAAAYFFLS